MSLPIQQSKYVIEIYQFDIPNARLNRIDVITTFQKLSYYNKLDQIGSAQFDLAVQDPKASSNNLIRYRNVIVIKRNGGIVWSGPITDINGSYTDVQGYITISCNTWLAYLQARNTDVIKYYPIQDMSLIAWNLINTVQSRTNGFLAITQGSTPTSISRDRNYEYKPISDCIIEMSNIIGGFDFDFTNNVDSNGNLTGVNFNTYPSRLGRTRNDLNPFTLGQNIKKIEISTSSQDIFNSSIMTGAGTGEDVFTSTLDYGSSEIGYTRREIVQSLKDAALASTVSWYNQAFLNLYSAESILVDLELYQDKEPQLGTYSLGDIVYINSNVGSGYLSFTNKEARIMEINVQVDDQAAETIIPRLQMQL